MTRQIATFAVISISVIFGILLIFIDGLAGSKLEIAVAVSALATGATGIILGLSSLKQASFGAIREYYQQGDTKEMIENRKKVYGLEIEDTELVEQAASEICGFYHFWGMMVSKGYLPIWIFEGSSGVAVVKLFSLLEPHISERQKKNKYYAEGFEQLAKKIKKEYGHTYEP